MRRLTFALLALAISTGLSTTHRADASDAILVEFSSPHCGPCRAMRPVVADLEREGVPVRRVDLEAEPHLATRYGVRETPTFLIVADGQEVARLVGMQSVDRLRSALNAEHSQILIPTGSQSRHPDQDRPTTEMTTLAAANTRPVADPRSAPSPRAGSPAEPSHEPMPSHSVANAVERARAATVRLRVHDGNGHGVGTGTIIDTHGDEALVLTCGHLFRETQGKGKVEVDLFIAGDTKTVPGHVLDYDADKRDIAVVAIKPGFPVDPIPVIAADNKPQPGEAVFSFGCDRGADPSRRDTRITGVDKYNQHLGLSNLEIAGAPIDGRSGGGLFDQQGRLIGVCNAADYEGDVGIYTGPGSVYWQLDRMNLANLYQPNGQNTPNTPVALNTPDRPDSPAAPRQPPTDRIASLAGTPLDAPAARQDTSRQQPAPTAISADDREVIVIIRDRHRPESASRMLELNRPSEELIRMLESQARR